MVRHIINHPDHTCAYKVTVNPTMKAFVCIRQLKWWMPLCSHALAIWRAKQSDTLCVLSTAALTDTGERPSLLAQSSHYPDPLWHTSSPQTSDPSDRTCAPLRHTSALMNPHRHQFASQSMWLRLRTAIRFSSISEYQGMFTPSLSCMHTRTHTQPHS